VSSSAEFLEFLKEQMELFGPVSMRRMFGGAGIYRDGLMFALVADDVLYLKTDDTSRSDFQSEGLMPFTYATRNGPNTIVSYHRAPLRCLEDCDEMAEWCRKAYGAALGAKMSPRRTKAKS
jgi:DNA transformation protein and related proteins